MNIGKTLFAQMHQAQAFFVTRTKSNTRLRRVYSAAVDRSTGLTRDQTIALPMPGCLVRYRGWLESA